MCGRRRAPRCAGCGHRRRRGGPLVLLGTAIVTAIQNHRAASSAKSQLQLQGQDQGQAQPQYPNMMERNRQITGTVRRVDEPPVFTTDIDNEDYSKDNKDQQVIGIAMEKTTDQPPSYETSTSIQSPVNPIKSINSSNPTSPAEMLKSSPAINTILTSSTLTTTTKQTLLTAIEIFTTKVAEYKLRGRGNKCAVKRARRELLNALYRAEVERVEMSDGMGMGGVRLNCRDKGVVWRGLRDGVGRDVEGIVRGL